MNVTNTEKLLTIVVTHYLEPWGVVKPFFDMLNSQALVDFDKIDVILVHDGGKEYPDFHFIETPYHLYETRIPHQGVSAARNFGMSMADSKWIMFCDCDDGFSSIYSLHFLLKALETDDFDMMWGSFYVQLLENPKTDLIVNGEFNLVWIHNKFYRLDFLAENNLKFPENVSVSEDSAFNHLVYLDIDKKRIGTINAPFPLYSWKRRPGSITTDPIRLVDNVIGHFERNVFIVEQYILRQNPGINMMVGRTLTDAYAMMTRKDYPNRGTYFIKLLGEFYHKYEAFYNTLRYGDIKQVLDASEKEMVSSGVLNPDRPSYFDWIKKIKSAAKKSQKKQAT